MLPRTINNKTCLIHAGQLDVTILYPQVDPAYARLAQKLADALNRLAGNPAQMVADRILMPAVNQPLPEEYRSHPLIILGNLNTNRALLTREGRTTVFVVAAEGQQKTAKSVVVKTGPMSNGRTVVLSGLKDRDEVIVQGIDNLNDGDRVEVTK